MCNPVHLFADAAQRLGLGHALPRRRRRLAAIYRPLALNDALPNFPIVVAVNARPVTDIPHPRMAVLTWLALVFDMTEFEGDLARLMGHASRYFRIIFNRSTLA